MKKGLSLLLALVLVFSLVACSTGTNETATETVAETAGETAVETTTEETTAEETTAEETTSAEGFAELALGTSVSLASSKDGNAQSDVTIAALALDAEGKIVKAHIDVAQSKVPVTETGAVEAPEGFKTKLELGPDYGMAKASEIGKEYDEQAKAFADYIVGKTIDEVVAIPTAERDENHPNVPTDADLLASVTIDIGAYQKAVADAANYKKAVEGAVELGLGVNTKLGNRTADAADGEGASVQFETTVAATAIDAEGKVVATIIDTAQNAVAFNADGTLSADHSAEGTTKKHLGADYGMAKASEIGKEWDEQVIGLEDFLVGKTTDEISGLALEEGVPTDADLLTTTTVKIGAYQDAVVRSLSNVK